MPHKVNILHYFDKIIIFKIIDYFVDLLEFKIMYFVKVIIFTMED